MVRNRFVAWFVDPLVAFGSPAPKLALIPVFTLWFGIDNLSKIMLVALTTVFPFMLSAVAGARTVALNQIWAARAMGSSEATLLWRIVLRAALPSLMSGLRVAVPTAADLRQVCGAPEVDFALLEPHFVTLVTRREGRWSVYDCRQVRGARDSGRLGR